MVALLPVRAVVAIAALTFSGYVFAWGDVEKESRVLAAFAGGVAFGGFVFAIGLVWWFARLVIGRRRPFGRTVFNYPLVLAIAAFGLVLAAVGDAEAYGAGAGSRSALTSAGSPRSGNGTSIASKSRGTTVAGKTARASSRTSRGK